MLADDLAKRRPEDARAWFVSEREAREQPAAALAPARRTQAQRSELFRQVSETLTARCAKLESGLCGCSAKVNRLVETLKQKAAAGGAKKVLIFVQRRVVCRLLAELLQKRLGWTIDWVVAAGDVGMIGDARQKSRGADRFSMDRQAAAIGSFKRDLRVLVATSIVEEGMDVPECDLVIDFDKAMTSREQQQRSGRARAHLAT